jgi:CheY-like chemotaxis protein
MELEQKDIVTILLADDNKQENYLFKRALSNLSVEVHLKVVTDGMALMDHLTTNPLPDILFIDLNMPRKGGLECLSEIKLNEKLRHIPVIIYSGNPQKEIADTLYQLGAHYYLHKCSFDDLENCIQTVLDLLTENPAQPERERFILDLKEIQPRS